MYKYLLLAITLVAWQAGPRKIPVKGYKLVWSDEFNGTRLDRSKWFHRNPGLHNEVWHVPHTVSLDGKGRLILRGEIRPDSMLGAQIATSGKFEFKYGYIESRIKLPMQAGSLPAFWIQSDQNQTNGTPERNGVELDIFEYWPHMKRDSVTHGLHYGGYGPTHKAYWPVWAALSKPLDGFHVFGLEWTPKKYTLYVDGKVTYSGGESLISHQKEFILLSLAVSRKDAGLGAEGRLRDSMVVDYVRVYKKKGA